jgi:tRNA 2-thiocytidine biosynthesis protein TtcA
MAYWQRQMRSLLGKAIHRYGMIQEGDRILVGVSGGKDSLTLLTLLLERAKRVPIHYEVIAVHVDLGFEWSGAGLLREFFEAKKINYHIEPTQIAQLANGPENRENPCFLCSWERRKRVFSLAQRFGCNKVAFGHHKDDIIQTLLLNIFYSAQISTMMPVQPMFDGRIALIRPLALLEERTIEKFAKEMGLPYFPCGCPASVKSKRREVKELINGLEKQNRRIKGNIFRALSNVKLDYLLLDPKKPAGNSGASI